MATSTTTKLGIVNNVLLNVGERQVTVTNENITARKALICVKEAYEDLCVQADWLWRRAEIQASSWSGALATIVDVESVNKVEWRNNDDVIVLQPVLRDDFYSYGAPQAWTTDNDYPTYFAQLSDIIVGFDRYPTTPTQQAKVRFLVTTSPIFLVDHSSSATDSNTVPVPERFVKAIVAKATAMFATKHLDDTRAAEIFNGEYLRFLRMARTREVGAIRTNMNMYRRFRNGY